MVHGIVNALDFFINHHGLSELLQDCVQSNKLEFAKIEVEPVADNKDWYNITFKLYNGADFSFAKKIKQYK